MLILAAAPGLAQEAGVKTNVLGWATTTPNIGVEIGAGRTSTINLTGALNPWNFGDEKHFRFWNVMPEYRYWFCEKFTGHFIGIHALGGQYNAKNFNFPLKALIISSSVDPQQTPADAASGSDGWPDLTSDLNKGRHAEGWYVGGGITYCYQWMLARHWNLEASIGVGYAYSKMTFYGRCNKEIDHRQLHYVGPTHASLSFMYMF